MNEGKRLSDFIQINAQKEYSTSNDFMEINRLIDAELLKNPDNVYLQRRKSEILLAAQYCDAFELE
jgi:hypothetical protein